MHETIPKYFGLTIAFLAPGLLGVYALSFFAPPVADWLGLAARQDANLGGFLFAFVASIGMGVFISGLRWLVLDWAMPQCPTFDYSKLSDPNVERAVEFARVHHYQFYQFYSNTLCALVLVFAAWFWTADPRPNWWPSVGGRFLLLLGTCTVLFFSARDCLQQHDKKVAPNLSPAPLVRP
jgi:hypothetical protein